MSKTQTYQDVMKVFANTAVRENNASNIFSAGSAYETGFLFEARDDYFGYSGEPDITEAVRLYQIAANLSHAGAQYLLAKAYLTGNGVPQDYIMAHVWFNILGSRSGDEEESRAMRDDVASRMTKAQIEEAQKMARHWKPATKKTAP